MYFVINARPDDMGLSPFPENALEETVKPFSSRRTDIFWMGTANGGSRAFCQGIWWTVGS